MTYLELCQQLVTEAGLSGTFQTVVGQSGEFSRVVLFVRSACARVEGQWINWRFRRDTWNFETAEGIQLYSPPEALEVSEWDSNRAYIDTEKVEMVHYDQYTRDPLADDFSGLPDFIVIQNDNSIKVIGSPDKAYKVELDFFKAPTILTANTDTPAIPARFHRVVLMYAMRMYGLSDEAPELKAISELELFGDGGYESSPMAGSLLAQLQASQLPSTLTQGASEGGQFEVVAT